MQNPAPIALLNDLIKNDSQFGLLGLQPTGQSDGVAVPLAFAIKSGSWPLLVIHLWAEGQTQSGHEGPKTLPFPKITEAYRCFTKSGQEPD